MERERFDPEAIRLDAIRPLEEDENMSGPSDEENEGQELVQPLRVNVAFTTKTIIDRYEVKFPVSLEPCEEAIIEEFFTALRSGKHLGLECCSDRRRISAVLATALSWLHRTTGNDQRVPDIDQSESNHQFERLFIATRSVDGIDSMISYLNQFIATGYIDNLGVAVLAPVDKLCHKCRKETLCDYTNSASRNYSIVAENGVIRNLPLFRQKGRATQTCNYRHSKRFSKTARVVLCTQAYLTSEILRDKYQVSLKNSIVILEDGGNVEEALYNGASFSLTTDEMRLLSSGFGHIAASLPPANGNPNLFSQLDSLSSNFKSLARDVDFAAGITKPGDLTTNNLQGTLIQNHFFHSNAKSNKLSVTQVLNWLENIADKETRESLRSSHVKLDSLLKAQQFLYCLLYMNASCEQNAATDYGLELSQYRPFGSPQSPDPPPYTLKGAFINFSKLFDGAFKECSSLIISSVSLPPWNIFKEELSPEMRERFIKDEVTIENNFKTNYFFGHCGIGPDESTIELNHHNKSLQGNLEEAGDAVSVVVDVIPGGIIVFVSSVPLLNKMRDQWKDDTNRDSILSGIENSKHVFWELDYPKPEHARKFLRQFRKKCKKPATEKDGAIMFALHRGYVSQLLDFEQDEVSCVIALGIPFHSIKALHIKTKKAFLEKKYGEDEGRKKDKLWYNAETWHKLSENFTCCVRKEQQRFIGLVIDNRFQKKVEKGLTNTLLPAWNRSEWKNFRDFEELVDELGGFMEENPGPGPQRDEENSQSDDDDELT